MSADATTSVQVLNEFANVARKKLGWHWSDIRHALDGFADLRGPIHPLTFATHRTALQLAEEHRLSFHDALIVASALEIGCNVLLTEDMQRLRRFGVLTISNPFFK